MSKIKQKIVQKGIQEKELLLMVRKYDCLMELSTLKKIVDDSVLPTPKSMQALCKVLRVGVQDIYSKDELDFDYPCLSVAVKKAQSKKLPKKEKTTYTISVAVDKEMVEEVLSKEALKKLGFKSKADAIRHLLAELQDKIKNT